MKEWCCSKCGLIFMQDKKLRDGICLECGSMRIIDCDSLSFIYGKKNIERSLADDNKEIHIHPRHPGFKVSLNELCRRER